MNSTLEPSAAALRLAHSRAELQLLFDPAVKNNGQDLVLATDDRFPRSVTMKILTNGHAKLVLGVLAFALMAIRPARTVRWLSYLPIGAIAKVFAARFVGARV